MNKISKNQKGFTLVEALLIILILVVIGGVGYMVYHNDHKAKTASVSTTAATKPKASTPAKPTTESNLYAGWQTYSGHGFTVKYPPNWIYQDQDSNNTQGLANDLANVTFSNHSIVTGEDAAPYPLIGVSVFSNGYIYDSDSPAVSANTNLTTFVRSMNGLIPSQAFSQVQQQTKTISDTQAIKFVGGDFDTPWTMKVGSNIYQFAMNNGATNPVNNTTLQGYFDNFLASFQLN